MYSLFYWQIKITAIYLYRRHVSKYVIEFAMKFVPLLLTMVLRHSSPPRRLDIAIRRVDGQPLTRVDLQYDFLKNIFSDTTCVFTDPYSEQPSPKICFRDLYVKAIMASTKATNALKERLAESPIYAMDFAMLALLVNIGRINTTMSCETPFQCR